MIIKKIQKKRKASRFDMKKDSIFRELSRILHDSGYLVRRENLKRGYGWRVMSGTCRMWEDQLIFVDRRMPQDDQISFLVSCMKNLEISVDEAAKKVLPEKIISCLSET